MKEALVLEIKGNSLDDGPGIRSVVFFKGCPLSCIWCHNPESKSALPEISYDAEKCIGCGNCVKTCDQKALSRGNQFFVDRDKCSLCFVCTTQCPSKAISRVGISMSQEELLERLLKDKVFYDISGGGVTLSGGEATLCTEWVGELAKKLHENGIHVLLETCGYFDYGRAEQYLLPYVDEIFYDIKIFDRETHRQYCGVYNDRILENFRRLYEDKEKFGVRLLPRVPLIPGITDTDENLEAIAGFMQEVGVKNTDLLSYNPTWYSKNLKIGKVLHEHLKGLVQWQSKEQTEHAKRFFLAAGISC